MKKLFSTIAVLAMLVANFATTSFAAVTSETPTKIAGSITKIDVESEDYVENYEEICADFVAEGFDVYSLKLSAVNAPSEVTYKTLKYTGSVIVFFSAQLNVTTDALYDEEYFILEKTGVPIQTETQLKFAEGDGSAPIDTVLKQSVSAGSTVDLVETIVAIVPEKTFSVDLIAAEIGTAQFDAAKAGSPTPDTYTGYILGANDGLTVKDASIANGLSTAGEIEPPAPSTPAAVKFYAVLPACEKAKASAVAQFQFDSNADGVADKGFNYDLGSLTWNTDVTVGVQVKDIDDGVTLALTNVIWQ